MPVVRRFAAVVTMLVATWLSLISRVEAALSRPGGGGGFSGGGGGFSGGGGGGFSGGGGGFSGGGSSSVNFSGGGGDDGGLTLIMVLCVGGLWAIFAVINSVRERHAWHSSGYEIGDYEEMFDGGISFGPPLARRPKPIDFGPLREADPNFSPILLEDFLYELYTRAHVARASEDDLGRLAPYIDEATRTKLRTRGRRRVETVGEVIVGSMRLVSLRYDDDWVRLEVEYETNFTETYAQGADRGRLGYYAKERWHLVRRLAARSRVPDETRGFNCPQCGAPVEHSHQDACGHCGQTHGTGEVDWLCNGLRVLEEQNRGPALTGDAPEVGTFAATKLDPQLNDNLAALSERDPQFTVEAFHARVEMIYHALNDAWSTLRWEDVRPFVSDRLWLSQRYWIDAYREQKLRNLMLDAHVDRQRIANVERDPFFDAITVRVWGSARDHTIHVDSGAVVGGNPEQARDYSEYWTFIRSVTRQGKASVDHQCPSCAAELKINMAGNCEFCGVKVTRGEFDWVLSKIQQDEAYRG